MQPWIKSSGLLVLLTLLAPAIHAAPSTPPLPASAPAFRTRFEAGEPASNYFAALSLRFGVAVVQPKPVKAFILKGFELPDKLDEALAAGQNLLEPQGLTLYRSVSNNLIVLRVVTIEEARKAELLEGPVTEGVLPEKIDISRPDRAVTHLLPVSHPELVDALVREARQVKDVRVDTTGGNDIGFTLLISGPAIGVQQAVENLVKIDKPNTTKIVARTMHLRNLNASELADSLNATFAPQQTALKAVADLRTNSIVITGPEDKVLDVMVTVVGMESARGRILSPPETQPAETPSTTPKPSPAPPGTKLLPRSLDVFTPPGENAQLTFVAHFNNVAAFPALNVNKIAFFGDSEQLDA